MGSILGDAKAALGWNVFAYVWRMNSSVVLGESLPLQPTVGASAYGVVADGVMPDLDHGAHEAPKRARRTLEPGCAVGGGGSG
ncbi:hypothetical protein [Embleya sp. NPDC059259]|uniref:hypothetical protein n=1 Tax=unclassified Embleya TaxID=2699296 RepID=UPI0036A2CC0A